MRFLDLVTIVISSVTIQKSTLALKQDPHSGSSLGCRLRVFQAGGLVTSTVMNKNRPVMLMKQETIGIIFDWDISTMHPLCAPKYSMTV